jgi:hypothetical protein
MRLADLDAITVDGFGTLLELESPVARLEAALRPAVHARGRRSPRRSRPRRVTAGRAPTSRPRCCELASLARCVRVLEHLAASLAPDFRRRRLHRGARLHPRGGASKRWSGCATPGFASRPSPTGTVAAGHARADRSRGTSTPSSPPQRQAHRSPRVSRTCSRFGRLGAEPSRTLHVGDERDDERGGVAAGMHCPSALRQAVEALA